MQVHFIILSLRIIQMCILEKWTSWSHLRILPTSPVITIVPVFLSYYYLYFLHLKSWFLSTFWSTAFSHKTTSVLSVFELCQRHLWASSLSFHCVLPQHRLLGQAPSFLPRHRKMEHMQVDPFIITSSLVLLIQCC